MKENAMRHSICFFLTIAITAFGNQALAQTPQWTPFEEAVNQAQDSGLHVLVDVWAPWCGWCRKMKKEVYPAIPKNLSKQFVMTRLNRDDHQTRHTYQGRNYTSMKLAKHLNTETVPAIVLLSPEGEYLFHITGFTKMQSLKPILAYVASKAYLEESFEAYLEKTE